MDMAGFIKEVYSAFQGIAYPGDKNIIHCTYDKEWGGTLDGPCRECSEVVEYFRGKGQYGHNPKELGWVAFGLVPFTPEAFSYWLPAFIEASVLHPKDADSVTESLEFRFESLESEEWQKSHIGKLSKAQLDVIGKFFSILKDRQEIDKVEYVSTMVTLSKFYGESS